jgi:TPR repeat protein
MYLLDRAYENGHDGLPNDDRQAVKWYRKTAADLLGGERAKQASQRLGR